MRWFLTGAFIFVAHFVSYFVSYRGIYDIHFIGETSKILDILSKIEYA